jgi:GTP1/Obg family GTP-binding protein
MKTTWKDIAPVPTSQEFLDIVLSRTQRRLPTQIRAGFKISRIRGVYYISLYEGGKIRSPEMSDPERASEEWHEMTDTRKGIKK